LDCNIVQRNTFDSSILLLELRFSHPWPPCNSNPSPSLAPPHSLPSPSLLRLPSPPAAPPLRCRATPASGSDPPLEPLFRLAPPRELLLAADASLARHRIPPSKVRFRFRCEDLLFRFCASFVMLFWFVKCSLEFLVRCVDVEC